MKLLSAVIGSIFISFVFGQNPGNVGTASLTAWFKPDGLAVGPVSSWTTTLSSIGGVTVTDPALPFPQVTNTPVGNVSNYNKTLFFNANSSTNLQGLQNTGALNLLQNNSSGAQGTFFCAYYYPSGNPVINNHMMLYNNTPHAIQFRNLGATGRLAIGLGASNSVNACRDWTETFKPAIISYKGNRSTSTSMTAFRNDATFTAGIASQSSGVTGLYFGFFPGNATAPYNGYIHEYIFYNTDLSNADIRKVNTYLAIKYGATLDNVGGGTQGDYVATNGATIWDASVNSTYHNDVIGIGRDDAQALLQKQSHSFSDDFRIYLSSLATNNGANSGTFASNLSFVTMGHNLDGCGTITSNSEAPATIVSRLGEEWKVQNTNFAQTFNWDLKIDTCTLPGSSVGVVDLSTLRLLVDNDGDFTNATIYSSGAGLTFSYNAGYVTISGISNTHLPMDSIRYFTLAQNTSTAYFTGATSICTGDSVLVTANIQNTAGPINLTYSDGTTTTTLNNIVNGYTFYVHPTTTTSYILQGYKSILNCCSGPGSGTYTITVNPYPVISSNASVNPICVGQSTVLSGSGGTTYIWNGGIVNGSSQSPTSTTTYTVIGQNAAGCADTASVTVTVNPLPTVSANASATAVCQGTQVTLSGSGANTYSWTNGVLNGVAFTPSATTTYTVNGTSVNNCSSTATVTVTVNSLPTVQANATSTSICAGSQVTLTGSGATSYTWNNGVLNNVAFAPAASGTYTVTGTDANNCTNTATIAITVNPIPTVTATASPSTICQGDSSDLLATGANTYVWNLGVSNGDSVSPVTTTTYTVIGTTLAGCSNNTSVTITVNPTPSVVAVADPEVVCEGNETTLYGQGAVTYSWTNGIVNNETFTPTATNTYIVTGTDGNGCQATDDVTVTLVPTAILYIGPDTTTCPQAPAYLFADSSYTSYLWSTGETTPTINVGTIGIVSLTVTDADGCEYSDDVVLTLAPDCFPTFVVPNVFTPNNDDVNDYFFIDATNVSSQTITIVNRWNNIMFNKSGPMPAWDGKTASGAIAEDGVYYVTYELKAENGQLITGTSFFHLIGK